MGPNGFVMPNMAQKSQYYDAALSDDGNSPQPVYPRSQSRMSTRSNATVKPTFAERPTFAENEVDMANLATGGQSMLRTPSGIPIPLSRPSSRATLRSALKQTPNRRNISIEDEVDDLS